jgi:hypothetical protein
MANDMNALGELICRLNPYTELPHDTTSGLATGEMQLKMIEPGGVVSAAQGEAVKKGITTQEHAQAHDPLIDTIAGIAVEVVSNYGEHWVFKGQSHAVKTAVLIPYRFPIFKNGKLAYWQTENLLIGYAGGNGGA